MLLEEVKRPFDDPEWLFELKFDGYRMLAEFGGGAARLKTRNGVDASAWFPEIVQGLATVPGGPYITDGEVCVLDEHGRADFDRLQDRALRKRWFKGAPPVTYCVFDLLVAAGRDIMALPLVDRKKRLAKLLKPAPPSTMFVSHFDGESVELFASAVIPLGLEGLVGKRKDSAYQPGVRSRDWLKIKRKGATPAQRFRRGALPKVG